MKTISSVMYSKDGKCFVMESNKKRYDAAIKDFIMFAYKEKDINKIVRLYSDCKENEIREMNVFQKVMICVDNLHKINYTLFCAVGRKGVPWYNLYIPHYASI